MLALVLATVLVAVLVAVLAAVLALMVLALMELDGVLARSLGARAPPPRAARLAGLVRRLRRRHKSLARDAVTPAPLAGIAALCAGGGERTTQIARVPGAGGGRVRAGRGLGDRNKFASLKRGVIRSLRRAGVGRRGEGPSAAAPSELWDQDAWERTAAAGAQRTLLSARNVLLARDM